MARNYKSNLPKVISRANRDISTIIENDIAQESVLLKDLVDQVLKANLEVKKKNNLRITETKRKLAQLDEEIDGLNVQIDQVDRETVIQQLNEMIDAENKIFAARQEIRYFDNEQLPTRIDTLNDIYQELTASVKDLTKDGNMYRSSLIESNDLLLSKQLEVTHEIINLMDQNFTSKQEYIQKALSDLYETRAIVIEKENELSDRLSESIISYQNIILESASTFSEVDNDAEVIKQIEEDHVKFLKDLEQERGFIEEDYKINKKTILDEYNDFEATVQAEFESNNKAVLEAERKNKEIIEDKLRQIRFEIMNSEKKGNIKQVQKYMKEFEKVEKKLDTKASNKVDKKTADATKKLRNTTNMQLTKNEIKYETEMHNIEYETKFEVIRYEEAKILHKIQDDFKGLETDVLINKKRVENLKAFLNDSLEFAKVINDNKLKLRIAELEILQENEYSELHLIESFRSLLKAIKVVERKRFAILQESNNAAQLIHIDQDYRLQKAIADMKLDQETHNIDRAILKKRNSSLIENEKLKEEFISELVYQDSLIKIAQKEHELQLIKVKSLYENERSLAEEQVERINLGVKVNDTFVKTTLQNQLLFATQQINCADSEFEIRVESVNLTHDQEVQYANKKIEYYRQKYEYDKSKFRKELEDKLEDLNYKLLLFTDEKDNKIISEKIQEIRDYYEGKIEEIEEIENQDIQIIRYEKVINDADNRAEAAINEAEALRHQTVDSFTTLYDMTKQKFDLIQETDQTEDTKGIMPLLNSTAISSADERLQLAIKEADELYKERIDEPNRIIAETKEKIIEITNTDETTSFIEEQKALKKQKFQEHKEIMVQLLKNKEEQIALITEERKDSETPVEIPTDEEDCSFEQEDYRKKEDIDKDYSLLIQKERDYHNQFILNLKAENKAKSQAFDALLKETTLMIKKTFKPYRSYLKKASKDITSKKRALKKQYDKILKKRLSEADKRIKDDILI